MVLYRSTILTLIDFSILLSLSNEYAEFYNTRHYSKNDINITSTLRTKNEKAMSECCVTLHLGVNHKQKWYLTHLTIYSHTLIPRHTKAFTPRWFKPDSLDYFLPYKWNYLYDSTLLKDTLNQYIDFRYLNKVNDLDRKSHHNGNTNDLRSRLIITAADIQKGEPVIFDNYNMDIDVDSIVACAGYPFYGLQWSTKDGRYLWDGSLLTNTPMLEAINVSPEYNKRFYIVDVFPREQKELPTNMVEVWHRARDIIFMDKTNTNIEMLKIRERYLSLLKKIHTIINAEDAKIDEKSKAKFKEIESEYDELVHGYGAVIEEATRIGRIEKMHYLFEDGDFSAYRIKKLIKEGEEEAEKVLTQENYFTGNFTKNYGSQDGPSIFSFLILALHLRRLFSNSMYKKNSKSKVLVIC
jgi:NTE family protein